MLEIFRSNLFDRLSDPNWEPFFEQYCHHLNEINQLVLESGELLEGNVFYPQGCQDFKNPSTELLYKRRSLILLSVTHSSILEIGFNAGHSALLMLIANPRLSLCCIDICEHSYTEPCADYLQNMFGDRFHFIKGDSQKILAAQDLSKFTAFHIDGGHMIWQAATDIQNCIDRARPTSVILFDDSNEPNLRYMLDAFMLSGQLLSLQDPNGYLPDTGQMFFTIR